MVLRFLRHFTQPFQCLHLWVGCHVMAFFLRALHFRLFCSPNVSTGFHLFCTQLPLPPPPPDPFLVREDNEASNNTFGFPFGRLVVVHWLLCHRLSFVTRFSDTFWLMPLFFNFRRLKSLRSSKYFLKVHLHLLDIKGSHTTLSLMSSLISGGKQR